MVKAGPRRPATFAACSNEPRGSADRAGRQRPAGRCRLGWRRRGASASPDAPIRCRSAGRTRCRPPPVWRCCSSAGWVCAAPTIRTLWRTFALWSAAAAGLPTAAQQGCLGLPRAGLDRPAGVRPISDRPQYHRRAVRRSRRHVLAGHHHRLSAAGAAHPGRPWSRSAVPTRSGRCSPCGLPGLLSVVVIGACLPRIAKATAGQQPAGNCGCGSASNPW